MRTAGVGLALGLLLGVFLGMLYGTLIGFGAGRLPEQVILSRPAETSRPSSQALPVPNDRRHKAWELPAVALLTALGLTLLPAFVAWLQARE